MKKNLVLLSCICLMSTTVYAFKFITLSMAPNKLTNVEIVYEDGSSNSTTDINKRNSDGTPGYTEFVGRGSRCVSGLRYKYNGGKSAYNFSGQLKPENYPQYSADTANPCNGCVKLFINENGNVDRMEICA